MQPKLLKEILNMFESESFNWWAINHVSVEQIMEISNTLETK